ncbi:MULTISPECIES: tetratricopeptide repeat protein [Brevibacterium]|uniref:Tetratricopeptide repeat protein n=1 Tax=Brevibacterium casei TaxID=33889 RepID=A0A449D9Z4_9MICO|nr:tetratricopeptide repeat protein [Brevibacterium casei]NJE66368.1 tetratricopeptide repeat protein [Brevibacterium sp. LS14]SII47199.1 thioredoxin domain-containing protein [Mycobacteroides abscessus subsp. abscessus]MCT1447248.1 tetratricopeptide repeat protein [Brevibacterium casei]MCT1550534.1 tetratricopeptide repeat protein [Brevibacterium casei]MCT1560016.1 tetratricopeptide repeat protein [Brevibacterium casei]
MSLDPTQDAGPQEGLDLSAVRSRNLPADEQAGAGDPNAVPLPSLVLDVDEAVFNDVVALSDRVPVVIDLGSPAAPESTQLTAVLERLISSYGGRLVLAKVDIDANPRLHQAFGVQAAPTVVAVIKGQPVPLFQGPLPEPQIAAYLEEILKLAAENGVNGRAVVGGAEPEPAGPKHPEAEAALAEGDFDTAESLFKAALAESPADDEAKFGLARAGLGRRLIDADPAELIAAADADPKDVDAAMAAADAQVVTGDPAGAFSRLISLIRTSTGDQKEALRLRVLDLFEIVGPDDPAVAKARTSLMRALF